MLPNSQQRNFHWFTSLSNQCYLFQGLGRGIWKGFARNIEPYICALGTLWLALKLSAESVMVASRNFCLKFGVRILRAVWPVSFQSSVWLRVPSIPRVVTGVWRGFARNIEPYICALGTFWVALKLSAESMMVASRNFGLKFGFQSREMELWGAWARLYAPLVSSNDAPL